MSLTISTYVLTLTHLASYQLATLSQPHLAALLTAHLATLLWPHGLTPPRSPFFFLYFFMGSIHLNRVSLCLCLRFLCLCL